MVKIKGKRPTGNEFKLIRGMLNYKNTTENKDGTFRQKEVLKTAIKEGFKSQETNMPKLLRFLREKGYVARKKIKHQDNRRRDYSVYIYWLKRDEQTFYKLMKLFFVSEDEIITFMDSDYYQDSPVKFQFIRSFYRALIGDKDWLLFDPDMEEHILMFPELAIEYIDNKDNLTAALRQYNQFLKKIGIESQDLRKMFIILSGAVQKFIYNRSKGYQSESDETRLFYALDSILEETKAGLKLEIPKRMDDQLKELEESDKKRNRRSNKAV